MTTPTQLPYDPEVDSWGQRILYINDTVLTYEEAYQNEEYVEIALGMKKNSKNTSFPIEFTQFVLRKMAVKEKDCSAFCKALCFKAKYYFANLIGEETSVQKTSVHPPNHIEETSPFRGVFTKCFCKKVMMNLQKVEDGHFDQFARVFPFVVFREVPDYKINILNCFEDDFYETIQDFLDQHFDDVEARQATKLFLNNIRDFLEEPPPAHIDTFPILDFQEIEKRLLLHNEYRNVRKHFNIDSPNVFYKKEELKNLPGQNIEEVTSLLQTIEFQKEKEKYMSTFKKYLFFFLHALDEYPNRVFFIDDVVFQCLLSLKKYKTVGKAIDSINEIALVALLDLLSDGRRSKSGNRYSISSSALYEIENYITKVVCGKRVQLNVKFDGLLSGKMSTIVDDMSFSTLYSQIDTTSQRSEKFFERIVLAVVSPDENPVTCIATYNAFTGNETKFVIPNEVRESLKNFIRLLIKSDATGDDMSIDS